MLAHNAFPSGPGSPSQAPVPSFVPPPNPASQQSSQAVQANQNPQVMIETQKAVPTTQPQPTTPQVNQSIPPTSAAPSASSTPSAPSAPSTPVTAQNVQPEAAKEAYVTTHAIPRRSYDKSGIPSIVDQKSQDLMLESTFTGRFLSKPEVPTPKEKIKEKLRKRKNADSFFAKFSLEVQNIQLHELLGCGGSGTRVYRASCMGLSFVAKTLSGASEEDSEKFKHEVEIMSALDSPYIVRYIGHSLDPREMSLYMEFFPGTFCDVIKKRESTANFWSAAELSKYFLQIARGVQYMHNLDPMMIHRDLKCENVFVVMNSRGEIGDLKIGDFDTTRIVEAGEMPESKVDLTHTSDGMLKTRFLSGTVGWIAPELYVAGIKKFNEKVDIWSLGMMIFEAIELDTPFSDISTLEKSNKCAAGDLPPFKKLQQSDSRTLQHQNLLAIFAACTQLNPHERPSANKIVEILTALTSKAKEKDPKESGGLNFVPLTTQQPPSTNSPKVDSSVNVPVERMWLDEARKECPPEPPVPILPFNPSNESFKKYMLQKYDHEKWENNLQMKAKQLKAQFLSGVRPPPEAAPQKSSQQTPQPKAPPGLPPQNLSPLRAMPTPSPPSIPHPSLLSSQQKPLQNFTPKPPSAPRNPAGSLNFAVSKPPTTTFAGSSIATPPSPILALPPSCGPSPLQSPQCSPTSQSPNYLI